MPSECVWLNNPKTKNPVMLQAMKSVINFDSFWPIQNELSSVISVDNWVLLMSLLRISFDRNNSFAIWLSSICRWFSSELIVSIWANKEVNLSLIFVMQSISLIKKISLRSNNFEYGSLEVQVRLSKGSKPFDFTRNLRTWTWHSKLS